MAKGEFDDYKCSKCGTVTYGPDLATYEPAVCGDCFCPACDLGDMPGFSGKHDEKVHERLGVKV